MPILSLLQKNTLLDATTITQLSLHLAYDASGGNEASGGDPVYARLPVVFNPAFTGQKGASNLPITFDVPPLTTITFVGMWDDGGGFQGMEPLGGDALRPFVGDADGTMHCSNHGFVLNDTLVIWAGDAGALPAGLTEGTIYYVIAVDVTTIQISAGLGGAPVIPVAGGAGFMQRILPQTFSEQGTFPVRAFTLDAAIAG